MTEQLDIFRDSLTEQEGLVWRVIEGHRGKGNPIQVGAIAQQTEMNERVVREVVSHLVNRHGKMIGSSTGNPAGFYVITDREELERHLRSLRHRGILCLVRAAALQKKSLEEIFGQARLEIKK